MAQEAKAARKVVSEVKGVYREFSDGTILAINVRMTYPWVLRAQRQEDDDGKTTETYGTGMLAPKDTHGALMKVCKKYVDKFQTEMQNKYPPKPGGRPFRYPSAKKFIKDGDAKDEDGENVHGVECHGNWVISTRSSDQPVMRGPNIDPETGKVERLTVAEATKRKYFYGGCYADVLFRPWSMDNKYGKRANAAPIAVMFRGHGEPFGQGRIKDEDIDDTFEGAEPDDSGGWDDDDDKPAKRSRTRPADDDDDF